MSKPQGLIRRGNVFYYRRRVPLDLVGNFGGKSELKESLHTQVLSQAKTRRNLVAAKFEKQFDDARARSNGSAAPSSDKQALAAIRDYVSREDARRTEAFGRTDWASDPDGTDDAVAETTALTHQYADPSHEATTQGICVAANEIFGSLDTVQDNWELLRRAVLEIERRDLARMKGDYSRENFDHLFAAQSANGHRASKDGSSITLGQLVEQYRTEYAKTRTVGAKRSGKINAALDLINRFFGSDTKLAGIDRAACRDFRDLLNQLPSNLRKHYPKDDLALTEIAARASKRNLGLMARETQDTYFNALKRLLDWAMKEGHIEQNRADGLFPLRQKADGKEARDPFNTDQLTRIFNGPQYRSRRRGAAGKRRHQEAQFWIPLLGLFTGMRLNEICQLDVGDVRYSVQGIPYIDVNNEGSNKLLKTTSSKRLIPIHPTLVEAGFLKFVRRHRSGKLFPELKLSARGYHSEQVSRWFDRTYLPRVGAKTATTSFHSFRHSFRDALRSVNAPPAVVEGLGGWQIEKGVSSNYGSGLSVDQLAEWMSRIGYADLDLSHLNK